MLPNASLPYVSSVAVVGAFIGGFAFPHYLKVHRQIYKKQFTLEEAKAYCETKNEEAKAHRFWGKLWGKL